MLLCKPVVKERQIAKERIIMSLEEECGVAIESSQAENLKTVGDIVSLVESLKA